MPRKPKTFHLHQSRKLRSQRQLQQHRFHHEGQELWLGFDMIPKMDGVSYVHTNIIIIKSDKIIKIIFWYDKNRTSPGSIASIFTAGPHRHSLCPSLASISSFRSAAAVNSNKGVGPKNPLVIKGGNGELINPSLYGVFNDFNGKARNDDSGKGKVWSTSKF